MIVITGGAGFIGSAIIQELNGRGRTDLIVVDDVDHPEKEKNLASIKYKKIIQKEAFLENILNLRFEINRSYHSHGSLLVNNRNG